MVTWHVYLVVSEFAWHLPSSFKGQMKAWYTYLIISYTLVSLFNYLTLSFDSLSMQLVITIRYYLVSFPAKFSLLVLLGDNTYVIYLSGSEIRHLPLFFLWQTIDCHNSWNLNYTQLLPMVTWHIYLVVSKFAWYLLSSFKAWMRAWCTSLIISLLHLIVLLYIQS